VACGRLLHLPKELRHEHRRPSGEHGPVRGEALLADLERDVRSYLGLEEARGACACACLMAARRRPAGDAAGADRRPDGDIASDSEGVVLEVTDPTMAFLLMNYGTPIVWHV